MPRSGVEEKPPWKAVPGDVRRQVQDILGSPVVRGTRVWGGYGPTPSFRLALADGRKVFFKGTYFGSNRFSQEALIREERVYRELSDVIGPWAPRFFFAFRRYDWHVLLLEDVGPRTVPPWTPAVTRRVAREYAAFHASTLRNGRELPNWLPRPSQSLRRVTWSRVAAESDGMRNIAALANLRSDEALDWLKRLLPHLRRLADTAYDLPGPYALLHGDTRSDNLRFTGERLSLFDWPSAEVGRPEFDVVAFAQSITVEGGPDSDQFLDWYSKQLPLRDDTLDTAVAWLAGFFADLAWRPPIPGLPRLRTFQRQQLGVMLGWSARRLHLTEPDWVSELTAP
jgi:hypothetical protein